jgi:Tubulin like
MGIYLIGIGGSGAKCVEAVVQLASVGLFTQEPIKVLFVDADESNGNLERSRNSLNIYNKCYQAAIGKDKQQCPWMQTEIQSFGLWSPFANNSLNKELSAFFNYNTIKQSQPELAHLFDVLYTDREKQEQLDVGFRGRPAIGAAVMSQVNLDKLEEEPWGSIIRQIQADVGGGKEAKVLLCGSIFGGTGASGLPTIARLIKNKLEKINVRDRVKVGSIFFLPYFSFTPNSGETEDSIYAKSEQFLLNTEAALRYYVHQAEGIFDVVYLLGNESLSKEKNFSIGKNTQRNQPHFIELYSALAARHFLLDNTNSKETIVLIAREACKQINWNDLPDGTAVQKILGSGTRFAHTWLAEIAPELEKAKHEGFARYGRYIPWANGFYDSKADSANKFDDTKHQEAIKIINDWCKDYLRWLYEIHQCESDKIDLFKASILNPSQNLEGQNLQHLIINDLRDAKTKLKDEPARIKNAIDPKQVKGINQGTIGLAQAVYLACQLG